MSLHVSPAAVMGFYFFPRGGSAQVARYLCRALAGGEWAPTLFTGSLGTTADSSNATRFFKGISCQALDYSPARLAWTGGGDPMALSVPMHASYEDKDGVPDRSFFALDDAAFDRQTASWTRFLAARPIAFPRVVHLHHLTPLHAAVRAVWPGAPVITQIHGTELKMLAASRSAAAAGGRRYVHEWVARMRQWAGQSNRLVVASEQDHQLALELLPVEDADITTITHGVDTDVFSARDRPPVDRIAQWRRWLVDDPRGWRPNRPEGSIRYQLDDLAAFTDDSGQPVPVVLFAGRFMGFKRLQLLIEAHHRMRTSGSARSVLVIVGGFPGEWEDEHPYDTVQRLGAKDVFFVGWRDHDDLAEILNCSDVFAAPSVDEPFGLVYLEAMAAGLPPIATNTGGPRSFINVDPSRPTGWLVRPDDVDATAAALTEAVSNPAVRAERGCRAAAFVRDDCSWASSASALAALYAEVADEAGRDLPPYQRPRPTSGVA